MSTVIGLPTCKHFDIVKVEAVDAHNTYSASKPEILKEFDDVFTGIGKCQGSTTS